jgi:ABC-type uncharacterized transport system involved in gliding motility auxiliary subunit
VAGLTVMLTRLFGILGWLGVALVLAAVGVRFVRPTWARTYNALALSGLAVTFVYLLSQWREIARSFSGRQARYGSLAIGSIVLVAAILVGVNYIAKRQARRWDLTANQVFSLSDQTRKVLQSLDAPVHVRVFARSDDFQRFRDRLTEYESVSKHVTVEYFDPDQKPTLASQFNVQSYGTVVFEYRGRTERAVGDGEQELTNALIKVVQGTQRKVYFVQGHGEKDPTNSSDRSGFSEAKRALESDNFTVETLPLLQKGAVPEDATVVVVAGPKTDYLAPETDALRAYLRRGGKLLLLLDPPEKPDSPPLTNLLALAHEWGIAVGHDLIVDATGIGQLAGIQSPVVPVALRYPSHPITENFNVMTAFPLARSVAPVSGGVGGHYAQSFIETGEAAWAVADLKKVLETGQIQPKPDKADKTGPISIGAAVSAPAAEAPADAAGAKKESNDARKPETRVAAIGDSDFATNRMLGVQGNRDLFLNTVNWLAQQENLIAIRPREPDDRRITMTAEQQRWLFWWSVVLLPALLFAGGVWTWWRRR